MSRCASHFARSRNFRPASQDVYEKNSRQGLWAHFRNQVCRVCARPLPLRPRILMGPSDGASKALKGYQLALTSSLQS